MKKRLGRDIQSVFTRESLVKAFAKNTQPFHSLFRAKPVGWGQIARRRIARLLENADGYVQTLNDVFTNPSGTGSPKPAAVPPVPMPAEPPAPEPLTNQEEQPSTAESPVPVQEEVAVAETPEKETEGPEREVGVR